MPLQPFEAAALAATMLAYLLAFGAGLAELAARRRGEAPGPRLGRGFLLAAFVAHGVLIGSRAWRLGDHSFEDAPSTLFLVTWCATLVASIIDARQDLRALPLFLSPPALVGLAAGAIHLRSAPTPLALPESGRLALYLHVGTAVVAYGALAFSAVLAVMYLFLEGQLKSKRFGMWLDLPALDRLEQAAGRFVESGFALLTLSLVVGVAYQSATGALGAFWLTSPKTLFAFATWIACGALVLLRQRALLAGRRQVLATLVVFGLVLLTYLGVNGNHVPPSIARHD